MNRSSLFYFALALIFLSAGLRFFSNEIRDVDVVGLLACGAVTGAMVVRGVTQLRES